MNPMRVFVLILMFFWSVGSWWYYTCKMKDYCFAAPEITETTKTLSDQSIEVGLSKPLGSINTENLDPDQDGLNTPDEETLGLNPNSPDSDGDGLKDGAEVVLVERPLDTDGDGIINALDADDDGDGEDTATENPDPDGNGNPDDAGDKNQDGIPDYLDPETRWATEDDDGDGLTNEIERKLGTNPTLTDSDGDSIRDDIELAHWSEQQVALDTDKDGIINALDKDDDNDGIPTIEENPDPNGDGDSADALDTDTNGIPDFLEDPSLALATVSVESEDDRAQSLEITLSPIEGQTLDAAIIRFPPNTSKAKTTPELLNYTATAKKYLEKNPTYWLTLTGHTDSQGDPDRNKSLGLRRATTIKDLMVEAGLDETKLKLDSKGQENPIADNNTEEGRRLNRRVIIEPKIP